MSNDGKECRQLMSKCGRALAKWNANQNPKMFVSSDNSWGWLKLLKYLDFD